MAWDNIITAEELGIMLKDNLNYQIIKWLKRAVVAGRQTYQGRKISRNRYTTRKIPKIEHQLAEYQLFSMLLGYYI